MAENRIGFKGVGVNMDNFLGQKADFSDCPFKDVPKDRKDYAVYRNYYETKMYGMLGGQGRMTITAYCEFKDEKLRPILSRTKKKEHSGCGACWACDHVIHQDPINPEGFYYKPFGRNSDTGYYLCATCHKLQESRRFDMDRVHIKCSMCVAESITQILLLKPDRCIDLRTVS